MSLPDLIVRAALDHCPLSPSTDFRAWAEYLYTLAPASEVRAWAWGRTEPRQKPHSTCGVFALACYRAAGVDGRVSTPHRGLSDLLGAYGPLTVRGGAIAALEALARDHGALRPPSEAGDVTPGAVLVVTGPEHAIVVTGVQCSTGGYLPLDTCEGGQGAGPDVRTRARELREVSPGAWVVRDRGTSGGRQLLYWVDPTRLRSC